jgi:hypothetical protein
MSVYRKMGFPGAVGSVDATMAYVPSGVCPCSYWKRKVSFSRI